MNKERPSDGLQGLTRSLLVVYPRSADDSRRTKAARTVWERIVSRTYDAELKRNLTREDFEFFELGPGDEERRRLDERLSEGDIKAVLAVGEEAFRSTTGLEGVLKLRGYIIEDRGPVPVIGTYGADYILAGKFHLARIVQTDLLKACQVGRHSAHAFRRERRYIPHPTPEDAASFLANWVRAGKPPIAFDIETPWSAKKDEGMTFEDDESYTVLMVSFAFNPYEAISFPWTMPYIDIAKAILRDANVSLVWNAKFDVPRLMANGCEFGGQIVDAMVAWHWLEPSLPMGLKFVAPFLCPDMDAWVLSKDKDMALYNCGDSDVLLRAYLEIKKRLELQGRWAVFERHFLEFGKILSRMTVRGIKVDLDARRESRATFERELEETIEAAQGMAPSEVRPVHPPKGYKKTKEELIKSGIWVEGEMRQINVEISDEEYQKEAAKQARKNQREEAKRIKALGKLHPKRRKAKRVAP